MTKEEWAEIILKISKYYGKDDFLEDDESKDLWYQKLKKAPAEMVHRAVDRYVAENRFPPALSDIIQNGREIWNEDKKKEAYVCMTKRSDQ